MTRRDLVVLAADMDMEHALRGLLSRHKSLPIRQIVFDIFVHPEHDAACARRGVSFLSPLSQRYRYALLIMDHEGSGREKMSADDLVSKTTDGRYMRSFKHHAEMKGLGVEWLVKVPAHRSVRRLR